MLVNRHTTRQRRRRVVLRWTLFACSALFGIFVIVEYRTIDGDPVIKYRRGTVIDAAGEFKRIPSDHGGKTCCGRYI